MLVSGVSLDLNWFLQFIFTVFIVAVGLLHFVKNTASKYFEVDANFEVDQPVHRTPMSDVLMNDTVCFVCGNYGAKQCSRCKAVRYCSQACQQSHWKSGHKTKCGDRHPSNGIHTSQNGLTNREFRSPAEGKNSSAVALVPAYGTSRPIKQPKDVLFPYDKFVKFFNSDKLKFPPCGLVNCGNSCFGNVVLQCLSFTKPLVAYLLEKGHRRECRRNDWCFLCEFQTHVERASRSTQAFSPVNILSRLPNIGGTLGYGRQEDAHEFMRFAVDTMQSVCLDEFGGEEAVSPSLKGTTLIHHIFRGQLQSQVFCTKCDKISSLYENMMDLTVEIQGDAASLEECLEQYTDKEWLLGENMYKCEGCKDYVKAWKRLTVKQASNILTIALKRFQSGRFGKLNKRITFPETLNLGPYMSEAGDGSDIYKLYAVVVHVDMLNASFFGHYICYIKDFQGNWYRIDDWKVNRVELEEVLSQGAYMLLYNRVTALPPGLRTAKSSKEEEQNAKVEFEPGLIKQAECVSSTETVTSSTSSDVLASDDSSESKISGCENESLTSTNYEVMREHSADKDMVVDSTSDAANKIPCSAVESSNVLNSEADKDLGHMNVVRPNLPSSVSEEASSDMEVQFDTCEADKDLGDMNVMRPNLPSSVSEEALSDMEVQFDTTITKSGPSPGLSNGFSSFAKDSSVLIDSVSAREDSEHTDVVKLKSLTVIPMHNSDYGNGYGSTKKPANALGDAHAVIYSNGSLPTETASAEVLQLKGGLLVQNSEIGEGNGIIEISGDIL